MKRAREVAAVRRGDGTLCFADFPQFRPNLTPRQVVEQGAFGGGYFRPIASGVTKRRHEGEEREFAAMFEGVSPSLLVR